MRLEVKFKDNCSADGEYTIQAEGYETAALYWADSNGILSDWTAFGYVKIDEMTGLGILDFCGGRAVPPEATHVLVRTFPANASDGTDGLFPIERERRIDCGSIRPTELGEEAKLALPEWKEGNIEELRIMEKALEVRMRTIHTKKWISRGYYYMNLGA